MCLVSQLKLRVFAQLGICRSGRIRAAHCCSFFGQDAGAQAGSAKERSPMAARAVL